MTRKRGGHFLEMSLEISLIDEEGLAAVQKCLARYLPDSRSTTSETPALDRW